MCTSCDGTSPDDLIAGLEDDIATYGWALIGVTGPEGGYTYTIGLDDHVGHPDLIVLDVTDDVAVALLTSIVDTIEHCGARSDIELARAGLRLVSVHPDHLDGPLLALWHAHYDVVPRSGEVLQVVVPDSWYCRWHAMARRRLDLPGPLVPSLGAHDEAE